MTAAPSALVAPLGGLPTLALRGLSGDITDRELKDGAGWLLDPRQPKPAVLAFDPGAKTGWALLSRRSGYKGGTLDRAGSSPKAFLEDVDGLLAGFRGGTVVPCNVVDNSNRIVGEARPLGVGVDELDPALLVVVEDTFMFVPSKDDALDGKKGGGPKTLALLARNVGAIIALATLRGLPVWRVMPTSWQSRILGKVRRDQGKRLSMEVARRHFGPSVITDHQSDAALVALYARGGR